MKKKVKKFAMGGMGSNISPIQTGARLAPPPDRVVGAPVRTLGMQNQQGGMPRGMGGMGGAAGLASVRNPGNLPASQALSNMQRQVLSGRPIQSSVNSTTTRDMMGGMGRGSSLPNSSGMKNPRGPNPQFMGDMLRKAQQIAGEQGAMATQGDPLQGLRSKTPGNLPAMGNLRNIFAQTAGAKGQVFKKGGKVKAPKSVSSASKRADGIAMKGKTKGRIV